MNSSRKETIMNEIQYWKKHQMLPDHYCDFLLALYSEGQYSSNSKRENNDLWKIILCFVLITFLLCTSVFVIYFTEFIFVLQTMILTSFVVLLLSLGIYYSKKRYWYTFFYIGAAMQLLLLSVFLSEKLLRNEPFMLWIILLANCLLWILAGWKLKLFYFIASGIVGIVILIIYISI